MISILWGEMSEAPDRGYVISDSAVIKKTIRIVCEDGRTSYEIKATKEMVDMINSHPVSKNHGFRIIPMKVMMTIVDQAPEITKYVRGDDDQG